MVALDDADMAAHVARQPCMRGRMDVPGAHTIAGLELRGRLRIAPELAAHHDALDVGAVNLPRFSALAGADACPLATSSFPTKPLAISMSSSPSNHFL